MLTLNSSFSSVYDGVKIKVDKIRVSGNCRFSYTGTYFTCYFSHPSMVLYFCAYCTAGSYHRVSGLMAVSSYNSSRSSRAMYNMRVSAQKVSRCSVGRGLQDENDYELNIAGVVESPKLKFMLYLFIMQKWSEVAGIVGEITVGHITLNFDDGDKDDFADEIMKMKRDLVSSNLMEADSVDPIVEVNIQVQRVGRRPGATIRRNMEKEINPRIAPVNLETLAGDDNIFNAETQLVLNLLPVPQSSTSASSSTE